MQDSSEVTYCVEAESKEELNNAFIKGFTEWAERYKARDKLYAECQPLYSTEGTLEWTRWKEFVKSGGFAKTLYMEVLGYRFAIIYDCTDENGKYIIKYFPEIFTVEEWMDFITPMRVE